MKIDKITELIKNGEPADFATFNFEDVNVRNNYRQAETSAFAMIAQRECMFCLKKANEDGMGGLGEWERIGYVHGECGNIFYDESGFRFKFNTKKGGYYHTMIPEKDWTWEDMTP